jgi:hypothetical protein
MTARRFLRALAVSGVAALGACDSGGPATVNGTVSGAPDVGAVVLDVVWAGVLGFEGQGSTQVYSAPVAGEPNRHRVILVGPSGGDLSFGIRVEDLYLEGPVVTVVEATGTNNLPRPVADLRVSLER